MVAGVSAPLRHVLERTAERVPLRAGIGLTARGLEQLGQAHAQARRALALAPAGRVIGLADLTLFEYLVATADDIAPLLTPARLDRLDTTLRRTLLAFADCDLNTGRTAARLELHPNTVQYRLQRIEKLTKRKVRRFWDLVELVAGAQLQERSVATDVVRADAAPRPARPDLASAPGADTELPAESKPTSDR